MGYTECKESKQCAPSKHHFDECVERVQKQEEEEGAAKEDCVEECTLILLFFLPLTNIDVFRTNVGSRRLDLIG